MLSPIYLHLIFDIFEFEISSLMNWIFFHVWTGFLQATQAVKIQFKLGKTSLKSLSACKRSLSFSWPGWEISGFCLLSYCQNERFLSFLSLYIFEESVFIFQFLNDKIHSYVVFDIIVHFVIQKLKDKHTFLKNIQTEKAEEPLLLTEREETKTRYFAP